MICKYQPQEWAGTAGNDSESRRELRKHPPGRDIRPCVGRCGGARGKLGLGDKRWSRARVPKAELVSQ
jgi:hypothetical protein